MDGFPPSSANIYPTGLINRLLNGDFAINPGGTQTVANTSTVFVNWTILTQTASIQTSQLVSPEPGQAFCARMTQTNSTAQRFGIAQTIRSADCSDLRTAFVSLSSRVRFSQNAFVRFAILQWTGTPDTSPTNVVNDWTSGLYLPGQFFNSSLSVVSVGIFSDNANVWGSIPLVPFQISPLANNLILFVWVQDPAIVNSTLDIGDAQIVWGQNQLPFEHRPYELEQLLANGTISYNYVNAALFGMLPSATSAANRVAFAAAWADAISVGLPLWIPPGTYLLSGTGTQGAYNGAALCINEMTNPTYAPTFIFGSGKGVTILKNDAGSYYNIIEVVYGPDGNHVMPITLRSMSFDGNGANNAQQPVSGPLGGDRYQNCIYLQNTAVVDIDPSVEFHSAAYHNYQANNVHFANVNTHVFGAYCNGFLLTGRTDLTINSYGQDSFYKFITTGNGVIPVPDNRYDTTGAGGVCASQRSIRLEIVSEGNSNHVLGGSSVANTSGGALFIENTFGSQINVVSDRDYVGGYLGCFLVSNKMTFTIMDATNAILGEFNATANGVYEDNDITIIANEGCVNGITLGVQATSGAAFQSNTLRIKAPGLSGGANKITLLIGANFKNNTAYLDGCGDRAGSANIDYFVRSATTTGGGNQFIDGRFFGTPNVAAFSNLATTDLVRGIIGYAPAASTITAGTSPYTFPVLNYDAVYLVDTANGITGYALAGKNLAMTAGASVFVKKGIALTVSWSSSAPTFDIIPQV